MCLGFAGSHLPILVVLTISMSQRFLISPLLFHLPGFSPWSCSVSLFEIIHLSSSIPLIIILLSNILFSMLSIFVLESWFSFLPCKAFNLVLSLPPLI